ncbi:MAG TPA: sugar ABC transporter substrate-binding protein, partial [Firmicutes bacterium]|nr:sugar ABC transporter substrate-binding protein [Bacillota bacterium]
MKRKFRLLLGIAILCIQISGVTLAAPTSLKVIMGLAEEEWQVMREHVFP